MSSSSMHFVLQQVDESQHGCWEQFVVNHPQGHLLQSWAWGAFKERTGWRALRLALWHGQQIVGGAQVLQRTVAHMPLGMGHLAYMPKGPLIDWSDDALCEHFFSLLTTYLKRHGAVALQVEPGIEAESVIGTYAVQHLTGLHMSPLHPVQPLRTIQLDLAPGEDVLLARMKEKWRYNVRLAGRKGVTVRAAETRKDVEAWSRILQATSRRDNFGIHTQPYYIHMWDELVTCGYVRLFLAEHEGRLLGGIFIGLFGRQALYLYGASSDEQRNLMPNYLLQWEAIRWAKRAGASVYDFWGIPDTDGEDEAMAGVYRFKRGWGGHVVQFNNAYEQVYHPLVMAVARTFL